MATGIVFDLASGQTTTVAVPDPTLAESKAALHAAVQGVLDAMLSAGFTVPSAASASLTGKVLQTRDNTDRTNWLTSQAAYSAQVAAGNGAVAGAAFRATDNSMTTINYAEGVAVLLAMAAWGASAYHNSWALKDAIAAIADDDATGQTKLAAININAGWPG